jgi:phage terminase large subunit
MYGGRGSAKTYSAVDAAVVEASLRPVRVLVTREIQNSIEDSIKAEIEAAIDNRNLNGFFDIQNNVIKGANGSRFIFKGLKNNIKSLKSISDVDIVLCEEAEDITKLSWDKLLPSIRPRDKVTRGGTPIIIVIFNPNNELDDTYQRFVVNPPPDCVVKLLNYNHNKYFPPHLERQRLHFKKTRPLKDYEHEWEGKPKGSGDDVIIDLEWVKAARFASRHPLFKKTGARRVGYDPAGQGKDTHACVYVDGNILKEIDEWVKSPDLRGASERAFSMAAKHKAEEFSFDECGGLGDGVSVFIEDARKENRSVSSIDISPFNAGLAVIEDTGLGDFNDKGEEVIKGTDKRWKDEYSNRKAQAHGIAAQKLFNTYRFIVLGDDDMNPDEICSIDIEDDELFNKLARELSTPVWVKSGSNSKKKVESKKDMEKRTGQPSPNIGDAYIMTSAPVELELKAMLF